MINLPLGVKFERTTVHNKKVAPAGYAFYVFTSGTKKAGKRVVHQLVDDRGATEEQLDIYKTELLKFLTNDNKPGPVR